MDPERATLVMHSKQWLALTRDLSTADRGQLRGRRFGDAVDIAGELPSIPGLNILVDDRVPALTRGRGHRVFLIEPHAVRMEYPSP